MKESLVHRFIPNSAPGVREEMLKIAGYKDVEEIYKEIPEALRFKGNLNLPKKPLTELEVEQKVKRTLSKNVTTESLLSFLGGGCYFHHVPALCSEIISRSEFLTAYAGGEMTDYGRYQAMFEYQSMMGELLSMDVVSGPVYDGTTAAGDALHIASRATGRREVLIPATLSPNLLGTMKNYAEPWLDIKTISYHPETGLMDLNDLQQKISKDTAAVFIENPGYLGFIEDQCQEIAEIAHTAGALLIVSVNPVSLGLLAAPGDYGADIACGEGQSMGLPASCGSSAMGILAVNDAERFIQLLPAYMVGISNTAVPGEYAFSWHVLWDRIMYTTRDHARSFTGTSSWLWGISLAVYMALMGPEGMRQLGETNIQKSHYASNVLSKIPGVKAPYFSSCHFNEFVVNFDKTGKSVAEINRRLLAEGILGGYDLSKDFPALGQSALYCVTEVIKKEEVDRLAATISKVLGE